MQNSHGQPSTSAFSSLVIKTFIPRKDVIYTVTSAHPELNGVKGELTFRFMPWLPLVEIGFNHWNGFDHVLNVQLGFLPEFGKVYPHVGSGNLFINYP